MNGSNTQLVAENGLLETIPRKNGLNGKTEQMIIQTYPV